MLARRWLPGAQKCLVVFVTFNDSVLPTVLQRDTLLREGTNDKRIGQLKRDGSILKVRAGSYLTAEEYQRVLPWDRPALVVAATVPKLGPDAVVSHVSAAAVHGLSVWPNRVTPVHISRASRDGGRRTATLHLHPAQFAEHDVVSVNGITVTSVARTVIDVARTEAFETGVVVSDHALHRELVTRDELTQLLILHKGRAGSMKAAKVITFADGRSESAGESRSRVAMLHQGMEIPELQFDVRDRFGKLLGRVDFAYVDRRVAGEFDGQQKYQDGFVEGVTPLQAFHAERRRTDALELSGWIVVRWMWNELATPAVIARKMGMAFDKRAGLGEAR